MKFVSYFPVAHGLQIGGRCEVPYHGVYSMHYEGRWMQVGVGAVDPEGDTWVYAWSQIDHAVDATKFPPVWVRLKDFLVKP